MNAQSSAVYCRFQNEWIHGLTTIAHTFLPGKGFVPILTVEGKIHLLLDTICTHSKQNKHFYREDVKKEKLKACELRPFNYFMYKIQFQATHSHALQKKILFLTNCCSLHVSEWILWETTLSRWLFWLWEYAEILVFWLNENLFAVFVDRRMLGDCSLFCVFVKFSWLKKN